MSFYPNGILWSELSFDKGLRHGSNITYYRSGKKRYEGYYKNDKQDSVWNYYDTLGILDTKVIYKNDAIVKKMPMK
jgi:antitoxin component YwqK of YwqJK toxin-antitoxin module